MKDTTIKLRAPAGWPIKSTNLSILGFPEGKEYVAIALEMDLHAYGKDFDAACEALAEMVIAQFAFAVQKRQPDLVFKDAEPVYWQIYDRERRNAMRATILQQDRSEADVRTGSLPIDDAVIAQFQRKKPFQRQRAAA